MTDDTAKRGLARRDFLRLAAGVPLVLGLPALGWAQEGAVQDDEPLSVEDALARARALGRPVLLVLLPGPAAYAATDAEAPPASDEEELARMRRGVEEALAEVEGLPGAGVVSRQRGKIARRLHALLALEDERTCLLLANVTIVIARRRDAQAAVPLVAERAHAGRGLWLLEAQPGVGPEPLDAALDGDDAAAARLLPALRARVLPDDDAAAPVLLAPRRDRELAALGRERAAVERELAALASDDFAAREAASAGLAGATGQLAATLTALALAPGDAEARARALSLVLESAREVVPIGAQWAQFRGSCGHHDQYEPPNLGTLCGMGSGGPARRYLRLLAPE